MTLAQQEEDFRNRMPTPDSRPRGSGTDDKRELTLKELLDQAEKDANGLHVGATANLTDVAGPFPMPEHGRTNEPSMDGMRAQALRICRLLKAANDLQTRLSLQLQGAKIGPAR